MRLLCKQFYESANLFISTNLWGGFNDFSESTLHQFSLKNCYQILKEMQNIGYGLKYCEGSLVKIYPSNPNLPFYSFHLGEKGLHDLRRFAKKNWNLDLRTI
jgi:hypothetical protein